MGIPCSGYTSNRKYASIGLMDEDLSNLPDDVGALKQVLKMALAKASAAEQKHLDAAAELAVAQGHGLRR